MAAKHEIERIPLRTHHRQEVEFIQSMVTNWEAIYIWFKSNETIKQTKGDLELLSTQLIEDVSKQKEPIVWMNELIKKLYVARGNSN